MIQFLCGDLGPSSLRTRRVGALRVDPSPYTFRTSLRSLRARGGSTCSNLQHCFANCTNTSYMSSTSCLRKVIVSASWRCACCWFESGRSWRLCFLFVSTVWSLVCFLYQSSSISSLKWVKSAISQTLIIRLQLRFSILIRGRLMCCVVRMCYTLNVCFVCYQHNLHHVCCFALS